MHARWSPCHQPLRARAHAWDCWVSGSCLTRERPSATMVGERGSNPPALPDTALTLLG